MGSNEDSKQFLRKFVGTLFFMRFITPSIIFPEEYNKDLSKRIIYTFYFIIIIIFYFITFILFILFYYYFIFLFLNFNFILLFLFYLICYLFLFILSFIII